MITSFQEKYASQVACLHISGISIGFISSLGMEIVTALYGSIAEDGQSSKEAS